MTHEQATLLIDERKKAAATYQAYRSIMRYVNELERRYGLTETPVNSVDSYIEATP